MAVWRFGGWRNVLFPQHEAAAPSDLTVDQGRMAVDMTVRILNGETPGDKASGFPFRSGPVIQVITQETIDQYSYERLFGPRDIAPILSYKVN